MISESRSRARIEQFVGTLPRRLLLYCEPPSREQWALGTQKPFFYRCVQRIQNQRVSSRAKTEILRPKVWKVSRLRKEKQCFPDLPQLESLFLCPGTPKPVEGWFRFAQTLNYVVAILNSVVAIQKLVLAVLNLVVAMLHPALALLLEIFSFPLATLNFALAIRRLVLKINLSTGNTTCSTCCFKFSAGNI